MYSILFDQKLTKLFCIEISGKVLIIIIIIIIILFLIIISSSIIFIIVIAILSVLHANIGFFTTITSHQLRARLLTA